MIYFLCGNFIKYILITMKIKIFPTIFLYFYSKIRLRYKYHRNLFFKNSNTFCVACIRKLLCFSVITIIMSSSISAKTPSSRSCLFAAREMSRRLFSTSENDTIPMCSTLNYAFSFFATGMYTIFKGIFFCTYHLNRDSTSKSNLLVLFR